MTTAPKGEAVIELFVPIGLRDALTIEAVRSRMKRNDLISEILTEAIDKRQKTRHAHALARISEKARKELNK